MNQNKEGYLSRMAYPKRKVPLTDEEKKERNRQYQNKRRHKTNNGYARAYRRASQVAVQWFIEHKRAQWDKMLEEELSKVETKPYTHNGPKAMIHDGEITFCDHSDRVIVGFSTACTICGKLLGSVEIEELDRNRLNKQYEV